MKYAFLLFAVIGLFLFGCLQSPFTQQSGQVVNEEIQPLQPQPIPVIIDGINESEGDFPFPA